MLKINFNAEQKKLLLLGLFIGSLLAANFLGAKITAFELSPFIAYPINFLFSPLLLIINSIAALFSSHGIIQNPFLSYGFFNTVHVSVGILSVPIMFLITDIVAEVYGKKFANTFVFVGLIVMTFVLLLTAISVLLPVDPTRLNFSQQEYQNIFGASVRIMIASIVAFLIAQYHDVWAFHFWKEKTKGKFLWLRNNVSTFSSQFIDSTIFMFIAFYGLTPKFTIGFLFSLIIPYWIFKILFALLDTPFVYLGVKWLKKDANQ